MISIRFIGVFFGMLVGGSLSCLGGDSMGVPLKKEKREETPRFDLLRLRYESGEGRGFDHSETELKSTRYSLGSFLSKPLELGGDWRAVPYFTYSRTELQFGEVDPGGALRDRDLHEAALTAILFHQAKGSDWTFGALGRVRFASDGREVGGDDFFYDVGIGAGYRLNDRLMLGLGFVGLEIGRDSLYVPGPMVMWQPFEGLNLGVMGPLLISTWEVNEDWTLALRGGPDGGTWNVDVDGESRDYDLSSYGIRFHTEHRLMDQLWLSLGVGYRFAGDFEVRDSSENRVFGDDLEGGLSFSAGLRLRSW